MNVQSRFSGSNIKLRCWILLAVSLCLPGLLPVSSNAQTYLPSTTDLWDISQGSVVTATSGLASGYDARDMFGGDFGEHGKSMVFSDGMPAGFVHWTQWQTPGPVTVSSFVLFAQGDGPVYNNEREFAQFVLKAKSSALVTNYDLTLYTLVVTNHPYNFVDPTDLALVAPNITPVTAQYFRAEITQYTAGRSYDGPRIIELDGFGTEANLPTIATEPVNQTVTNGANATFSVTASGPGPLSYQWLQNGVTALTNATNAALVLTNVQSAQSGTSYSVVVSNSSGSTNSASATLTVITPILPSTNSLWDISQGTVVTATSGIASGYDARDMFGGDFGEHGKSTVFSDGMPAGFVHYIQWQTPSPVTVSSFALFAQGDGPVDNNERELAQFVLKAKSSALATNYDLTLYTLVVTNHPYNFVDPIDLALVATNITPVTAQYFRAEITQYTGGRGYDGPRILELDGFGTNANPPVILTQPASQTAAPGNNVTFTVAATGPGPFGYQWFMDGSNVVANATNASLTLTNVQSGQSGSSYLVMVSNSSGSTNSASATLTVITPILPSTNSLWDISQGSVVTATSGLASGYDARDMFGGDFGDYGKSTVFSDEMPAGFVHWTQWQTPGPVTVSSFVLFAQGDGPVYNNEREFAQFVLKAKSSPLATNYDLTLYTLVVTNHPYTFLDPIDLALVAPNITPVTSQYFRAEITQYTGGRGYDGPRIIELDGFGTNVNPPVILTQPKGETVTIGMNATFTVRAVGPGPLAYQWLMNGSNVLAMETNAVLVVTNVQPDQTATTYSVVVSNFYGSTISSNALLTVLLPPSITLQPTSALAVPGCAITFTSSASGGGTLTYQWQKNGTNLPGQTATNLALLDIQTSDFASYAMIAKNAYGAATSSVAVLALENPPIPGGIIVQRYAGGGIRIPVSTVLANATDPNGAPITLIEVNSNSLAGGIVVFDGASINYLPPAGYNSPDAFNYTISDGNCGGTAVGIELVEVRHDTNPACHLTMTPGANGSIQVIFDGMPGQTYRVQSTTNMTQPNWQDITNLTANQYGTYTYVDWPASNGVPRYFRSVSP